MEEIYCPFFVVCDQSYKDCMGDPITCSYVEGLRAKDRITKAATIRRENDIRGLIEKHARNKLDTL